MWVLDAHASTLHFVQELETLMLALSSILQRSCALYEAYDLGLRGPLSQLEPKSTTDGDKVKSTGGKRFKNMLHQVQNGTGDYAIEWVEF